MIPERVLTDSLIENMISRMESQEDENKIFMSIRDTLINEGLIHNFATSTEMSSIRYCSIDGARINSLTQGMDNIFLSAATMHDGFFTLNSAAEDIPHILSSSIEPYNKVNDKSNEAIMMLSEIGICGSLPHYDIRAMDGAYPTALITLMRTLSDYEYEQIAPVIDFIMGDHSEEIFKGINELLNPPQEEGKYIIGLSKSDSTKDFLEIYKDLVDADLSAVVFGDKNLASRVLRPGEMFVPITKNLGSLLITQARTLVTGIEDSNGPDNYKDLVHSLYESVNKNSLNNRVYTTYFCPSENSKMGRVHRIDFSLPEGTTVLDEDRILEHADKTIQVVNRDIVSVEYNEPYAQYKVDEECKKIVSRSKKNASDYVRMKMKDSHLSQNLTQNYRT